MNPKCACVLFTEKTAMDTAGWSVCSSQCEAEHSVVVKLASISTVVSDSERRKYSQHKRQTAANNLITFD